MPESYNQNSSFDRESEEDEYSSFRPRNHAPRRGGEFRAPEFRPPQGSKPKSHFEIDDKITIKIDYDFAVALGQFLLEANIVDKRFKSLGHHLCNLEQE